jgi:hypothetical protein
MVHRFCLQCVAASPVDFVPRSMLDKHVAVPADACHVAQAAGSLAGCTAAVLVVAAGYMAMRLRAGC